MCLPSGKGYRSYSTHHMGNMTDAPYALAGHSQLRLRSHAFVDLLPHGCRPGIVCCLCSTDISRTTCELRPMNSLVRSPTLSVALDHIPVSRAYIISGSIMESTHLQEEADSKEQGRCSVVTSKEVDVSYDNGRGLSKLPEAIRNTIYGYTYLTADMRPPQDLLQPSPPSHALTRPARKFPSRLPATTRGLVTPNG